MSKQTILKKERHHHSIIGRLSVFLAKNITNDALNSGKPENLIKISKKYVRASVISAMIIYPLIIILLVSSQIEISAIENEKNRIQQINQQRQADALKSGQFSPGQINTMKAPLPIIERYGIPPLPVLLIIPLMLFAYPKIALKNLAKNRQRLVEEELPFFSLFAAVMQSVNTSLYSSFQITIGKKIFAGIENEALLLNRDVELFGRSPLEAIEEIGRNHNSQVFKNFLLGYSSITRSGGDLSKYLETNAEEQFRMLKLKYASYSTNVGYVVESIVVLLIIVPILFVVSSFILPIESVSIIGMAAGIAIPITTIAFSILLAHIQPKTFNVIGLKDGTSLLFLVAAVLMFFVFIQLDFEMWLSLALSAIIASVAMESFTFRHRRQIEKMEKALPDFLRDLTEYKKIGIENNEALIKISEDTHYNKTIDRLIQKLSMFVKQGYSLNDILMTIKLRSWFARNTFFVLSQISESGGGTPAVLESVTTFVRNTQHTLKEAKSAIAIYDILGYMSPIILVITVAMSNQLISSISLPDFTSSSSASSGINGLEQLVQTSPDFLGTLKTFIITSSIGMGFLLGKSMDRTFKSTLRIAIMCTLALLSILVTENTSILENLS